MNFSESRDYLQNALTFGIRLGLQRMERLMVLLGNPQNQLQVIHIAGTNGKGSVTNYCASILASGNYRVGVYTSPYLERFTERIRVIEGEAGFDLLARDETAGEIEEDLFAQIMTRVRQAVEQMLAEGAEHPTEFELITACAFVYFQQKQCDWVVLETGLGGRLDSTNIIKNPQRVIITALGYDHMDRLGGTMAEIAAEKAGIIKPGCPVFLYDPNAAVGKDQLGSHGDADAALSVIVQHCKKLDAPLFVTTRSDVQTLDYGLDGQTFCYGSFLLWTRLLGTFQPMNAALALAACQNLVSADAAEKGVSAARWPARLEVFPKSDSRPLILLDGAHNPQGCLALGQALEKLLPEKPIVFLVGLLADKDYASMLNGLLVGHSFKSAAFVCVTPDNPRALPATELANVLFDLKIAPASGYNGRDRIHVSEQPEQGLELAIHLARSAHAPLCVFGSLYLAGQLRARIRDHDLP